MTQPTPSTSSNTMEVNMSRLDYSRYGYTFYKDEPGMRPVITLKNVPHEWFIHGNLNLYVGLGLRQDVNEPSGWKMVNQPLKLYEIDDRRHNKQHKHTVQPGFKSFVKIQRSYNAETNTYEIPLCKGMELSRKYQLSSEFVPEFTIVVYSPHANCSVSSNPKFVIMSKRQPAKIKEMRDPNAPGATRNGAKRMKRSEQVKALVSSNKSLIEQYQKQMKHIKNLERQNEEMVHLLKQLNKMAKLGQETQSTDVLACFRICLHSTDRMHWMKEQPQKILAPINKRTAEVSLKTAENTKKRRL